MNKISFCGSFSNCDIRGVMAHLQLHGKHPNIDNESEITKESGYPDALPNTGPVKVSFKDDKLDIPFVKQLQDLYYKQDRQEALKTIIYTPNNANSPYKNCKTAYDLLEKTGLLDVKF